MVMNLVASIGARFLLALAQVRLRLALIPLFLLIAVGPRLEVLGLAAGLILLSLPPRKRSIPVLVPEIAAATVASLAGFRIEFVTDPSGGFIYLTRLAVPLTIVWVVLILRLRESLRRALPRPAVQLAVDLIIVVNACLLSLALPGIDGIARLLPVLLLGVVLTSFVTATEGKDLGVLHQAVAFSIALYGIGGVMKGAVSLALLLPLMLIALPVMISSRAFFAPTLRVRGFPRSLSFRGMRVDRFVLSYMLLTSALTLGVVLAVHRSAQMGMLSLSAIPLLALLWRIGRLRERIIARKIACREKGRIRLFGIPFSDLNLKQSAASAEQMINTGGSHVVVTPNTVSLMRAQRNKDLFDAYLNADLVVPDGVGLVWATRLLGVPLPGRVPGIVLAEEMLRRRCDRACRVFLLGGREGVAVRARACLLRRFPGLDIVGTQHGYFSDEEEVIDQVRAAQPDILLVGMGVPRQELFMTRARNRLDIPLMIGIGGALDIFAGDRMRAPLFWQSLGLEWLYRVFQEPRRMRDALLIPRFMTRVLVVRGVLAIEGFLSLPEESD
ncbi:MAG: WecB/TagA/CpsF family glycosyltransferase [Candidatus Bipolaricaulota bacterium]|nr:WecB/TagA/CpsF family glycosyltransferase [Candidatus Bipolaricaulota bacterium]